MASKTLPHLPTPTENHGHKSSVSEVGDRIHVISEMLYEFFYGTEELPFIFILILFSHCDFICILLFRDIFHPSSVNVQIN